ncbi:ATP-dependent helicase [Halodesulfurarchaeum sp.]|uniref:ATP-dependent helicase n=1 Tax=Halodesulfurarchaeum sp. TaxID=1980530 RepID=UPI002FC3CAF6
MNDNQQFVWLPSGDEGFGPRPDQETIIESSSYPMRVLAGAGTGKTFTMVRKIEYLIDEENVAPDDILALTFTNKAADSMQEKLNAKLGPAGYDVDAYTYHSICQELLSEFAYYADVPPDFEIAQDGDKLTLILDILDDIPYRFIKPDVQLNTEWGNGVVASLQGFISAMKRSGVTHTDLDTYLGDPHRVATLAELPSRIEELASEHVRVNWRKPTPDRIEGIRDGLSTFRSKLESERTDLNTQQSGIEESVNAALEQMEIVADALDTMLAEHIDEIIDGDLTNVFKLPAVIFGAYENPPSGIPDDFELVLTANLTDYLETAGKARDLTDGYAAFEQRKTEARLLDFDDLVVETAKLLDDEELRAEIAEQWEYVFCDEFQDTDRLQFDLVNRLTTDENLFVVGDDDQAIYEWRGANVENIRGDLDASFDTIADANLTENFRSRQPVLDLANNALDLVSGQRSTKTLTRYDEPGYEGDTVATISAPEEEGEEAEQILNAVSHVLAGDTPEIDESYSPGDIAILVRKNRHAKPIVEAFEEAGIPYQVAGNLTADSVGVETVLAYLKALARPYEDEVSLNRVLTMRYRLHQADLRSLNTGDENLITMLREAPVETFEEPGRIEQVRTDVDALLDLRDRVSIARLYQELKDRTNMEWYLSPQEQRNLQPLEEFIASFGEGPIQATLDEQFVEVIEYFSSVTQPGGASTIDQTDMADDAVNIMTIHKSKGLDFPVVVLPKLVSGEWEPQERNFTALNHAVTRDPAAPVRTDFEKRDAHEARRLLHVGVTRAENLLVLQGRTDEAEEIEPDGEVPLSFIEDVVDDTVPWNVTGVTLPIWKDIQISTESHADWTDSLAATQPESQRSEINHHGEALDQEPARERVLSLARQMLDGSLEPVEEVPIAVDRLEAKPDIQASLRHSYTSLETFAECPRRHYLDYVTRAFEDYESETDSPRIPTQREVGLLFHKTAELAGRRGIETESAWRDLCEEIATQNQWETVIDHANECIADYFESPVSEWDIVSAEREFAIEIGGETITGYIDAIYRTPSDELLVIDYKATERTRSLEKNRQLPLYLLATRKLLDKDISTAGYLYVGPRGPELKTRTYTTEDLEGVRDQIREQIETINQSTFDDYTAGDHCQWCPHRSLPCSDDW